MTWHQTRLINLNGTRSKEEEETSPLLYGPGSFDIHLFCVRPCTGYRRGHRTEEPIVQVWTEWDGSERDGTGPPSYTGFEVLGHSRPDHLTHRGLGFVDTSYVV